MLPTARTGLAIVACSMASVFVAGCAVTPTRASAPTTQPSAAPDPNAATRCAQLKQAATANPALYSPDTYWNVPAACHETRGDSARWSDNWFNYATVAGRTDATRRGAIDIAFDEYSTPIYSVADATTNARVFISSWGHGDNLTGDRTIPWNPAWRPAAGNDGELIIVDPATGREWGLWSVQTSNWMACMTIANITGGYQPGVDLCVGLATLGTNPDGTTSDYRIDSGYSHGWGRGMGDILGQALLPRVEEVERGSINHALNMETYSTMFGPACTPAQMGTSAAGTSCGFAVSPATRIEWINGAPDLCGAVSHSTTVEDRSKTVPEGMRFVADLSDDHIERWLDQRGYTGAKRRTAKVFAVALRDYGWIISDTSCWGSSVAVEGVANPDAAARWRALGITSPAADGDLLLDGLITSSAQVRAIAGPDDIPVLTFP